MRFYYLKLFKAAHGNFTGFMFSDLNKLNVFNLFSSELYPGNQIQTFTVKFELLQLQLTKTNMIFVFFNAF